MKKRIVIYPLLIFTLNLAFCTKSSTNSSELIVGKWMEVSGTPSSNFAICDFQGSYIDLKSDNTYTEYSKCSNKTTSGTYKVSGNTVTVISSTLPIPVIFNIITITATDLILEDSFLGSPERVSYKR